MRGSKPGERRGGRQKGTPNKATAAKAEAIAASGLTPLDYMLSVMRNEQNTTDIRLDAANKAAPFVHPKLAAVEHSGKIDSDTTHHGAAPVSDSAAFIAGALGLGEDAAPPKSRTH